MTDAQHWEREWHGVAPDRMLVETERRLVPVQRFLKLARIALGGFGDRNVLELGSGLGRVSLLIALEGARVTLVDENEEALRRARELFSLYWLMPKTHRADLLAREFQDFPGEFDIVMSWGLLEHFSGCDRGKALAVHVAKARWPRRGVSAEWPVPGVRRLEKGP